MFRASFFQHRVALLEKSKYKFDSFTYLIIMVINGYREKGAAIINWTSICLWWGVNIQSYFCPANGLQVLYCSLTLASINFNHFWHKFFFSSHFKGQNFWLPWKQKFQSIYWMQSDPKSLYSFLLKMWYNMCTWACTKDVIVNHIFNLLPWVPCCINTLLLTAGPLCEE